MDVTGMRDREEGGMERRYWGKGERKDGFGSVGLYYDGWCRCGICTAKLTNFGGESHDGPGSHTLAS